MSRVLITISALCYRRIYETRQSADVNRHFSPELRKNEISVMVEVIRSAAERWDVPPETEQLQEQLKNDH